MTLNDQHPAPDLLWFRRHLLDQILPHWLDSAASDSGFFHPQLNREWRPIGKDVATLVSQCRLIFNFSIGYQLTGEERYLRAVERGIEFLSKSFHDREQGGWFFSCDSEGKELEDAKSGYGHAFVIFALASAARATGSAGYRQDAAAAWEIVRDRMTDRFGGVAMEMSRETTISSPPDSVETAPNPGRDRPGRHGKSPDV